MRIYLLLVSVCLFLSCKKSDNNNNLTPGNIIEADFNLAGANFHWNLSNAGFLKTIYPSGDTLISIVAGKDDKQFTISLFNITQSGSYQFGTYNSSPGKSIIATFIKDLNGTIGGGVYYISSSTTLSGSITLNITNNKLTGTFNVICWNGSEQVTVSNGKFNGVIQ